MRVRFSGDLDLEATLHSGQAFRWVPEAGGWHAGYVRNRPVRVRTAGNILEWQGESGLRGSDLVRYFRLNATHDRFLRDVRRDAHLELALGAFPGLRLLDQDPWEVFVAYIVSQNSNIAKITRTLEALARIEGEPLEWAGRTWHRFPRPNALAGLGEGGLRTAGMGYRAPFLHKAALQVARGDLRFPSLRRQTYERARARLLEVPGIGEKVADCILLYGLGHLEAFPTDVWIERVMRELYFRRRKFSYARVGDFARKHFGPQAGYAQHFLFHYRRRLGVLSTAAP